jgi:GxxExxY protein
MTLLYKEEVFRIVGAAMEVHKSLGCGFLEAVYHEALGHEFEIQKIPFLSQAPIRIVYKERILEKFYIADYIVFECIILELKALDAIETLHTSQMLNYLKATNLKLGLLINFGNKSLEWKRIIL